jgi:ATP synthase F1 gamma subunit
MNTNQIEQIIRELSILKSLTSAYAEISSRRMKSTRQDVLSTREFLRALHEIFDEVRRSYHRKVLALSKKRRTAAGEKITFLAHNGKTVAVLLSSNTGLYGDIVRRTFNKFKEDVRSEDPEVTIIGRLGRSLFLEEWGKRKPYTYFDFPDIGLEKNALVKIASHLVPYEKVNIYYGKFKNVVTQDPEIYNVSAETSISEAEEEKGAIVRYLFEPSLEDILIFFEKEMFASLFEQTIRESQLAKFASRMLAMDKAYENIEETLDRMRLTKLKAVHSSANRKQIMLFSSMHLWRG